MVAVAGYLLEGALFGGLAEDFSLHIVVIIVGEGRQGPRRRRRRARRRGRRRLRAELQPVSLHRGVDGGGLLIRSAARREQTLARLGVGLPHGHTLDWKESTRAQRRKGEDTVLGLYVFLHG